MLSISIPKERKPRIDNFQQIIMALLRDKSVRTDNKRSRFLVELLLVAAKTAKMQGMTEKARRNGRLCIIRAEALDQTPDPVTSSPSVPENKYAGLHQEINLIPIPEHLTPGSIRRHLNPIADFGNRKVEV